MIENVWDEGVMDQTPCHVKQLNLRKFSYIQRKLSSFVTILILLSDVNGLYTKNPKIFKDAIDRNVMLLWFLIYERTKSDR